MEKIDPRTADITRENIERLIELFPSVATETTDADGSVRSDINFDALRELIGAGAEGQRERYQFTWPGKRAAKEEARRIIDKTMRPETQRSTNWDDTQNLYIEGDNLEALKLLRSTYAGRIRLIYIDPPYNTGHDLIYDDDFALTRAEYDADNGDYDEWGGRLVANLEGNGRFHSDWCSMMYPRLLLARDLLANDGAIFISIDDCEQKNLRAICDEVFGRANFAAQFIWEKAYSPRMDSIGPSAVHDYILCYVKSDIASIKQESFQQNDAQFNLTDDTGRKYRRRSLRKEGSASARADRPNGYYPIEAPDGTPVYPIRSDGTDGRWRWGRDTYEAEKDSGALDWVETPNGWQVYVKQYLDTDATRPVMTLWKCDEVGHNHEATEYLKHLLGGKIFDSPKPVALLKKILSITTSPDNEDIVLDFFAGSSTMAEAVMQANAKDGGNRSFLLVQIPEEIADRTVARGAGYSTICEIGEERIRRAGAKIVAEVEEANRQLKIGEEPKPAPDVGFRVLRIDSSNFTDTYATPDGYDQDQLHLFEDNVKPDRSDLDLLFQVLPTLRIPYSAAIEEIEVCGKRAFDVNHGQLVACFDVEVGADCIEQIAKMRPIYAVFRDASMADDATEANFEELFKTFSPDTVRKVI